MFILHFTNYFVHVVRTKAANHQYKYFKTLKHESKKKTKTKQNKVQLLKYDCTFDSYRYNDEGGILNLKMSSYNLQSMFANKHLSEQIFKR